MKIEWATHKNIESGNSFGYSLINHHFRNYITEHGVEISDSSSLAVHLCHPENFNPAEGKKNILFTMCESAAVPSVYEDKFKLADAIFTPSKFCADIFRPIAVGKPMRVSPLGFDGSRFTYKEKSWRPGEQFVWLWLGAPNARKGWDLLLESWVALFSEISWMQLFMKTSSYKGEGKVVRKGNITLDSRSYREESLANLYQMADGFILPTQGEGWGLSLLEALGSGLPIVTTRWGGQLDFLSSGEEEYASFLDHEIVSISDRDGDKFDGAKSNPISVGSTMSDVMGNYEDFASLAKRGCEAAHRDFSWEKVSKTFIDNINSLGWDLDD